MSARRGNRPDAPGRRSGRAARNARPPEGEPWVWLLRDLLRSLAWRALSLSARRFIDFLLIEHMNHAGTENGNLMATYDQLQKFGIRRNSIAGAIAHAEDVGLIECRKGPRQIATRYTLTFYAVNDAAPTNRWRFYRGTPLRRIVPVRKTHAPAPETGGKPPRVSGGVDPDLTPRNGGCVPPPETATPSISWEDGAARAAPDGAAGEDA
jgi:hypothetical protein